MLGTEGDFCETLTFSGPVTKMEASMDQNPETLSFSLNSIRYYVDTKQKTYGEFIKAFGKEWLLSEEKPLIGLFGLTNPLEKTVVQLGLVLLNTQC